MNGAKTLAVYIHWPFCLSKCPYCDFNSHVRDAVDQAAWREALLAELRHHAALLPGRLVTSIFFGGGTPSLMDPATVTALIAEVRSHWDAADDLEVTLEANPTSVEADHFAALAAGGVNRVSLGVQSFDAAALQFLGRQHDLPQALDAIAAATRYFPRASFDLIYARAGQSASDWERELRAALPYARGHLSLYQLTIEPNTAFYTRAARGENLAVPPELAADLFLLTQDIMNEAGLPAYEISNHAAPGQQSRHNLTYWRYDDFIGLGPGAHGRYVGGDGVRRASVGRKVPEVWLKQVQEQGQGAQELVAVDDVTARREALMMGLRLDTGIDRAGWRQKFGADVTTMVPEPRLRRLQDEALLVLDEQVLRPTPDGALKLNALLRYLLEEEPS